MRRESKRKRSSAWTQSARKLALYIEYLALGPAERNEAWHKFYSAGQSLEAYGQVVRDYGRRVDEARAR